MARIFFSFYIMYTRTFFSELFFPDLFFSLCFIFTMGLLWAKANLFDLLVFIYFFFQICIMSNLIPHLTKFSINALFESLNHWTWFEIRYEMLFLQSFQYCLFHELFSALNLLQKQIKYNFEMILFFSNAKFIFTRFVVFKANYASNIYSIISAYVHRHLLETNKRSVLKHILFFHVKHLSVQFYLYITQKL